MNKLEQILYDTMEYIGYDNELQSECLSHKLKMTIVLL